MPKPTVIITVSGGNVQSIKSDQIVKIILVDEDNIEAGDPAPEIPEGEFEEMAW